MAMAIFNWLARTRRKENAQRPPPPEVNDLFGPDSPFISYVKDGTFIITDRESFDYQFGESQLPDPAQRSIDALLAQVTRVRARCGGIYRGEAIESAVLVDTFDADAIAAFRSCFTIVTDPVTFSHCACLGGPTLELFAGDQTLATIGLQHGNAIRWNAWKHDAQLVNGTLLTSWLTGHGVAANLLALLYQNPFAFTGGRMEAVSSTPLDSIQQRLLLIELLSESRNDPNGALAECDALLADHPGHTRAHAARGFVRRKLGQYDMSIADFTAAIDGGERSAELLFGRAVALDHLGRHAEAISDCTSALAIDPRHANAYNSRGVVRLKLRQLEEAHADFTAAIDLAPQWDVPHFNRAMIAMERSDWPSAITDYTRAIQAVEARNRHDERPFLARLYWNRGHAQGSLGDDAAAASDWRRASSLDPSLGRV
jgi:tetratricopeptide (TPR) repeat protein